MVQTGPARGHYDEYYQPPRQEYYPQRYPAPSASRQFYENEDEFPPPPAYDAQYDPRWQGPPLQPGNRRQQQQQGYFGSRGQSRSERFEEEYEEEEYLDEYEDEDAYGSPPRQQQRRRGQNHPGQGGRGRGDQGRARSCGLRGAGTRQPEEQRELSYTDFVSIVNQQLGHLTLPDPASQSGSTLAQTDASSLTLSPSELLMIQEARMRTQQQQPQLQQPRQPRQPQQPQQAQQPQQQQQQQEPALPPTTQPDASVHPQSSYANPFGPHPAAATRLRAAPPDHAPMADYAKGAHRMKPFGTHACTICKGTHPTAIHETARFMIQVFKPMGDAGDTKCSKCGKIGHNELQCQRGEWLDHPDNPPLPEGYEEYARPYPVDDLLIPFTRYQYMPQLFPRERGVSSLPASLTKGVIGLVNSRKGIDYAIEFLDAQAQKKKAPAYDGSKHKPWNPYRKSANRNPKPPVQEETGLAPQGEAKPKIDDGFRGVPHHFKLPSPRYTDQLRDFFTPEFMNAIEKFVDTRELPLIVSLRVKFDGQKTQWRKCQNDAKLAEMNNTLAEAWDIISSYIPEWHEEEIPIISREFREKITARVKERTRIQSFQHGPARHPVPQSLSRCFPEPGECGFRSVDSDWAEEEDITPEQHQHPMVAPKSDNEATAHIKLWVEHQEANLDQKKVKEFKDWFAKEFQSCGSRFLKDVRLIYLAENATTGKGDDLEKTEAKAKEDMMQLRQAFTRRATNLIRILQEELEAYDDGSFRLKQFYDLQKFLRNAFGEFDLGLRNALGHAFNESTHLIKPLKLLSLNSESTYQKLMGAMTPMECTSKAQLPRLVWPKDFEQDYEAKLAGKEEQSTSRKE